MPSSPTERDARLERVLADYLHAEEAGTAPDRAALLKQHPDLAADLGSFFRNRDALERIAEPIKQQSLEPETIGPSGAPAADGRTMLRYFGDYELLEEIARGGMGVVYRARQVSLNRIVAVKMILAGQLASQADVQRFQSEAEAAAGLDHPHIVPIYEVGEHEGQHYFSMKLIEGGSLGEKGANKPGEPSRVSGRVMSVEGRGPSKAEQRQAAELVAKVARAVHHAHQRGILHRDLKPANILLDAAGQPHITDFGLARRVEGTSGLTQSGVIVGTPSYMAPEQVRAEKQLTTGVDVYSLGAILYELLTGRPPFQAKTPFDTLMLVLDNDAVPLRRIRPEIDGDLETITLKCMHKQPESRYGSAAALADDLQRWLNGEPIVARAVGRIERASKWVRRNKGLSAGLVSAALALVLGTAVASWKAVEAGIAADNETKQRKAADAAFEKERWTSYRNQIALAQAEWLAGNPDRAEQALLGCPTDLRHWEWNYVWRLCHPEKLALPTESYAVAFSPDGKYLAIPLRGEVRLYDPQTGRLVRALTGHGGRIAALSFSRDSRILISGASSTRDYTARAWEVASGRELSVFRHTHYVSSAACSPTGRLAASVASLHSTHNGDGTVEQAQAGDVLTLWDTTTGAVVKKLPTAGDAVAFDPAGGRLVAVALKKLPVSSVTLGLRLYEVPAGKEMLTLGDSVNFEFGLTFRADGKQVAAANYEGTVRVWDTQSGHSLWTFHEAGMWTAFAPDGRHLATAGGTGADTIHIWDLTTGRRTGLHHGAAPQVIWGATSGLCYSPDGRQLAVVSINGQVKILDPNTIPEARILSSNVGASIYQVAFSEDGERFLLSGDQRMLPQKDPGNGLTNQPVVSLWNASSGQELLILRGTRFPVGGAAFSPAPNSRRVASLPDSWVGQPNPGNEVTLWDYTTGKQIRSFQAPTKASNVIFSPDGRLLALGSKDSLEICDAETGKVVRRLSTPADSLSWSSDGRHLATADSAFNLDGIQVWNATEGTLWRHLAVPQATQNARSVGPSFGRLAFSPDGRLLAGASENNTQAPKPGGAVTVWDVETGQQVVTLRGHTNQVNGVAFSPDGRRLISGSSDGTVRVWELATGHTTLILRGHKDGVRCVAFSPDGRRIASSDGKETRIWDGSPMAIPPAEAALKQ